jgi:magnesium-transporting ATPase (P-type)
MRMLFNFIALSTLVLFVFSSVNFLKQLNKPADFVLGEVKGFGDVPGDNAYGTLINKYAQRIQVHSDSAAHDQKVYFWLSLLVTVLTAAATLASAIQAAKQEPSSNKSFAILLAVITFCTTMTNFVSSHYNETKTEEVKKASDLKGQRSSFLLDYQKATTVDAKTVEINKYDAQMGD